MVESVAEKVLRCMQVPRLDRSLVSASAIGIGPPVTNKLICHFTGQIVPTQ